MELHLKYRPKRLQDMIGQDDAVAVMEKFIKSGNVPRVLLFTGPPGVGKTSAARIMAERVGCEPMHFHEMNTADFRGIDTVRDMLKWTQYEPLVGNGRKGVRVWLMDECHQLTGDAQEAMLKILEPEESNKRSDYYFLCTTEPFKLKPTLRRRCQEIQMKLVDGEKLIKLIHSVAHKEIGGLKPRRDERLTPSVVSKIAELAAGSPATALVLLERVLGLESEAKQLAVLERPDAEVAAFELVKELMPFKGRPDWRRVAKILTSIQDEDPEGVRQLMMKVARTHLLKGDPTMAPRAKLIIEAFRDPLYGGRNATMALLAANCWDCVGGK